MIIMNELPEEEPKEETTSDKVFTQQQIRDSIKQQREYIKHMLRLIEEADEELRVEKKIKHRNKTVEDFLNGDGLI